jgi:hypothetical protein
MESLFDAANMAAMQRRVGELRADREPLWGKMTAAQMVAHCRIGTEMAMGEVLSPRHWLGRLLGPMVKTQALKEGVPMRKGSPTMKELVMGDGLDFEREREGLREALERFAAGGQAGCTTHPHAFFGKLTAEQWSILMYKHLDHHLRQFGV